MNVIVYSTAECPWCKQAKAFLRENKIPFTEKDVGEDQEAAKEMAQKSGGALSVPILDVNGKIILGFDKEKLKEALKL